MATYRELGLKSYEIYLKSTYWKTLHDILIKYEKEANCWICDKNHSLLIHHVRYDMLFEERLGESIYRVCFKCHEEIHFRTFFFILRLKTPLTRRKLLKRMRWLKMKYLAKVKKYPMAFWYFWRFILS